MKLVAGLEAGQQEADIEKPLQQRCRSNGKSWSVTCSEILQRLSELTKERGGAILLPIVSTRRNVEHVNRKDGIHALVADGRRTVEEHEVVGVRGQGFEPA